MITEHLTADAAEKAAFKAAEDNKAAAPYAFAFGYLKACYWALYYDYEVLKKQLETKNKKENDY